MPIHNLNSLDDSQISQFLEFGGIISWPNSDKISLCLLDDAKHESKIGSFGAISFFGSQTKHHSVKRLINTNKSELKGFISSKIHQCNKMTSDKLLNEDLIYQADFNALIDAISKQKLKKCVLKSRQYFKVDHFNLLQLIYLFLSAEHGFIYGLWQNAEGYLGLTPETLVSKTKNKYTTMALAGTKIRSKRSELLEDPKEILEHNIVIEDIKSKLQIFLK